MFFLDELDLYLDNWLFRSGYVYGGSGNEFYIKDCP